MKGKNVVRRGSIEIEGTVFDIGDIVQDVKEKTFSVQSLIGQRARLRKILEVFEALMTEETAGLFRDVLVAAPESKSQFFQDVFALMFAGGKRDGFFVEFGACDGQHLSNTYLLEKRFGWSGILSEPARAWHEALGQSRAAKIDHRCVAKHTGASVDFFEASEFGRSSTFESATDGGVANRRYTVETISLQDLLRENRAPSFIDFLSIDTEGNELEILESFDFSKYGFGFIAVEQHNVSSRITSILSHAGYEVLFPRVLGVSEWSQISGFDMWYVPKGRRVAYEDKAWLS